MPTTDLEHAPRTRSEQREAALHSAALELLAEVGYERLTIDAVAARAHASKATIYRRYSGKAELVVAALRRRDAEAGPALVPAGDLRADVYAYVEVLREAFTGPDGALLLGLLLAANEDPELHEILDRQFLAAKRESVDLLLAQAEARGDLPVGARHDIFHEVVPGVVLLRVLRRLPVDDAFIAHVVEDVALPLLTR